MPTRSRIRRTLTLVLALLLVPSALAHANPAYDRVATAYGQAAGQLDPCAFSKADLQAALRGIPKEIASYVPAVRKAIEDGIAAHDKGVCKGRKPTGGTTTGAAAVPPATTPGTPGTPTTPAATTPSGSPAPGAIAPGTTTPSAGTPTTPATRPPTPAAAATTHRRDRTPLVVAGIALGALALLGVLGWAWARLRGWDPVWTKTWRHAWGEAGYRTTSTWSEFTDWLRLGR